MFNLRNNPLFSGWFKSGEKVESGNQRYKKIWKWCLWIFGVICLIPVLLFLLVYFGMFGKLYSKEELKNIQNYLASEVYSEDGKVLGKFYWENSK